MDEAGISALFLLVIALDLREGSGETPLDLVASLRARPATDPAERERFEDALLAAGYIDAHASRYADSGYRVRSEKLFQVRGAFPG
ncbi:MAG: PD-(D/E)XK motif protein [Acidobacteria bacterium]|nr:PD-(D/E)XK motif protein [Acidobacteriota bacterium]MBI3421721.1 PD-(D/E)XK motif protein [Acidobacteriota bacterium]